MRIFILTLQFLTRIPVNINLEANEEDFAKGVIYFPVIGLVIGALNLVVFYYLSSIFGRLFSLVGCVMFNVLITGALHLDGLADTWDGIYSARSKEKILEIMKDSRIGTYGTVAIIFDLFLRIALMYEAHQKIVYLSVLLSPVVSRSMIVLLMHISKYVRSNGMGGLFIGKQSSARTFLAIASGAIFVVIFLGYTGAAAFLVCIAAILLYKAYIYSKIGGMTGDTVGAANEIMEVTFILLIMLAGRYGLL